MASEELHPGRPALQGAGQQYGSQRDGLAGEDECTSRRHNAAGECEVTIECRPPFPQCSLSRLLDEPSGPDRCYSHRGPWLRGLPEACCREVGAFGVAGGLGLAQGAVNFVAGYVVSAHLEQ